MAKPTMQLDNVYGFPKWKMRKLLNIVDNYFIVREQQGPIAANDYIGRSTPKQLRKQVVQMINAGLKIRG